MHAFHYQNHDLFCEETSLAELAEAHGTPLYVYSGATLLDHYRRLDQALNGIDHEVCYAVKANSNLSVLNLLAREHCGFDIVSAGELFRVVQAGGLPEKCTFAGVGKARHEIEYALNQGILSFNVESEAELVYLNEVAGACNRLAPVALRVNPDVEAKTHKYISTGKSENKFGIPLDRIEAVYERAAKLDHLRIRGVQMHIGSQITTIDPFVQALHKIRPLVERLRETYGIEFFSIGGGIGIVYDPSLESGDPVWWKREEARVTHPLTIDAYAGAITPILERLNLRILLEPGRYISGNAGVLLTRVLYIKKGVNKTFVIVDAGMNDLIRPALYEGYHEIVPVTENTRLSKEKVDVVGPICESGDFLALDRELPKLEQGDLLAVMSAGAYGFTMASNYNSRPMAAEVLVQGAEAHLARKRQTLNDLIRGEALPL